MEYASEITNDTAKTYKNKLDSVQHKSLTAALGVNRLSHRKDVNYESAVMPLELRRQIRIVSKFVKLNKLHENNNNVN